jgi:hypothetical protein
MIFHTKVTAIKGERYSLVFYLVGKASRVDAATKALVQKQGFALPSSASLLALHQKRRRNSECGAA